MPSRLNIKMQRLILLLLIPALSVITLISGVVLYRNFYRVIIEGFDRKLYALGTTTATFIDGDALLTVIEPYHISGLAWDSEKEVLYGVCALRNALVTVDPEHGGAEEIGVTGFNGIADLAYDAVEGVLYGISLTAQQLIRIDPQTGAGVAIMSVTEPAQGLTWDGRRLLAAGHELLAIIPGDESLMRLTALERSDLTGLAYDSLTDTLYGMLGAEGMLVTVNPTTGLITEIGELIPPGRAVEEVEYGTEAGELPAYGLTWNPTDSVLYAAADRLMVLDPATGAAALELWLSKNYCNPASATYETFAQPMRATLREKDVTYLYTFKLGGRKDIVYLVDASPEDEWCPIGYEEDLPPQNVHGIVRTVEDGTPFISDVLDFELWGLLKVVAVPIYNAQGEIRAMAGVDVNIGLIRTKTRVALFQVLGFGAVSLMGAGLLSLWVTRRLTRPINQLKYGALHIAAGQYSQSIEIKNPRELRELASTFNDIGHMLQRTMHEMVATSDQLEASRQRSELAKTLPTLVPDIPAAMTAHIAARWSDDRPHCADISGYVCADTLVVHWIGRRDKDLLLSIKRRSDISLAASCLLAHKPDPETLLQRLDPWFHDDVLAFVICNPHDGSARISARQAVTMGRVTTDQVVQRMPLVAGQETVVLAKEEALITLSSELNGQWLDELTDARYDADTTTHAGRLADRLTNRLQSQSIVELTRGTGLLTVFTGSQPL